MKRVGNGLYAEQRQTSVVLTILCLLSFDALTLAQTQGPNAKGSVLQTRTQCVHIAENGRRNVANCSKMLESRDAPDYRKVEELPFISLLKEQS